MMRTDEKRPRRICFLCRPAQGRADPAGAELEAARTGLAGMGFSCRIIRTGSPGQAAAAVRDMEETLFVTDSAEILAALREQGKNAAAYLHGGNPGESFPGADYLIQEPGWIDADSWNKIYQRLSGYPWFILETDRCLVREFVPEDLDAIYDLYDEEALRWLQPPSEDRGREQEILKAYISRIYGLYGYGHWAILYKETGQLIGRTGFSAPTAADSLGEDACFGYLTAGPFRRQGLTLEVCRALLGYGFTMLGFETVSAGAARENTASLAMLERLGFRARAERQGQIFYLLQKEAFLHNSLGEKAGGQT